MVTGVMLFFASPEAYYHNVWFRFKVVFMIAAVVNLAFFHNKIQKTQAAWDNAETPPPAVRRSAAISLICWTLVIGAGLRLPFGGSFIVVAERNG